jgi:hypothetical protein
MRFFSTIVLSGVLSVGVCASLAAQEGAPPARFVPGDSCIVVRAAAPAKWKQHFAKTGVAKLFGGETLAPLLAQANAAIDAGIEQIRGSGKFDADLLQRLLKDYAGYFVFSLQIDFSDVEAAIAANRPPAMSMVLALTPDGSYDLGALATAIQTSIESEHESRSPLKDLQVGDLRLRVTADLPMFKSRAGKTAMQATLPFVHDGHLVMLIGTDLEKDAARLLGAADRWEGEIDGRPFFAHAQLDRLMQMFMKGMAARMPQQGAPFDVVQVFQDLGLGSLKSASVQLGAEDKHVVGELQVTAGDGERGLLSAVMLDQARPKLLRWVPANSESFSVSAFDAGAAFRTVRSIWEHLGDAVPMTFEHAMEAFAEATKVRLEEELIAHLGTEVMVVRDMDAQLDAVALEDMEAAGAFLGGSCVGIALRNGKAFGESLEKILRSRGLHAARKSEDYADTKVHRLTIGAMLELEYAVTDDLLLLALGKYEASRRNLRAVLDARAKAGEGSDLAPAVAAHVAAVPAGWSGISVTQVAQIAETASTMLGAMSAMDPGMRELEAVVPVMKALAGEMKRFGLQLMISTSHTSERSYVQRLRW